MSKSFQKVSRVQGKLSLKSIFYISSAIFAHGVLEPLHIVIFPFIIMDLGGGDKARNLICSTLVAVIALVLHPLVGLLTDFFNSKMGRRIPLMLVSAPCMIILLLFFPYVQNLTGFVICVVALYLAMNIFITCHGALLADLIPSKQMGKANGIMEALRPIGFISMTALVGSKFITSHFPFIWVWYGIAAVAISTLLMWKIGVGYAQGTLNITLPPEANEKKALQIGFSPIGWVVKFRDYVKSLFDNPQITPLFIVTALLGVKLALLPNLVIYAQKYAQMSKESAMSSQNILRLAVLVCVLPMGLLGDRIGKRYTINLAFLITAGACITGFFSRTPMMMRTTMILLGIGTAGTLVMLKALFAERLPPKSIGKLAGAAVLFLSTGRATAGVIFGEVITGFGLPAIWWVGGLTAFAAIFFVYKVPEAPKDNPAATADSSSN